MPRYYFHLSDEYDRLPDPEGLELPDLDAVALRALREVRGLVGQEVREEGAVRLGRALVVEDEGGAIVHRLPFIEAIQIAHARDQTGDLTASLTK